MTVLWMSALTGYIIKMFGWQMTFIIEGLPSVLWGVVWYLVIRDRPEDASWISAESANSLETALRREQSAIPRVPNVYAALRNPMVLLLCAQYFFWSIGVYGFVLWLPVIIQKGSLQRNSGNRLARRHPLRLRSHSDGCSFLLLRSSIAADSFCLAVFNLGRSRVLRLLSLHEFQLLAVIRLLDSGRSCDVRTLWSLLRNHPGGSSQQCRQEVQLSSTVLAHLDHL